MTIMENGLKAAREILAEINCHPGEPVLFKIKSPEPLTFGIEDPVYLPDQYVLALIPQDEGAAYFDPPLIKAPDEDCDLVIATSRYALHPSFNPSKPNVGRGEVIEGELRIKRFLWDKWEHITVLVGDEKIAQGLNAQELTNYHRLAKTLGLKRST
jgi:hypothetical protein